MLLGDIDSVKRYIINAMNYQVIIRENICEYTR